MSTDTPTIVRPSDVDTLPAQEMLEGLLPYEEPDNNAAHRAHIVNPPMNVHLWQPGMTSKELVDIARATQAEITALCGYTWVPKYDPDKFEICNPCMDRAGHLMRGARE